MIYLLSVKIRKIYDLKRSKSRIDQIKNYDDLKKILGSRVGWKYFPYL